MEYSEFFGPPAGSGKCTYAGGQVRVHPYCLIRGIERLPPLMTSTQPSCHEQTFTFENNAAKPSLFLTICLNDLSLDVFSKRSK